MTSEHLPNPGIDELIAEFAGSLSYPPGYLERERRGWDRDRDDTSLKLDPDSASGLDPHE